MPPEGWFFELWDLTQNSNGELVLCAHWPDGGELTVTHYRDGLRPEIVEWFWVTAQEAIAPLPESR